MLTPCGGNVIVQPQPRNVQPIPTDKASKQHPTGDARNRVEHDRQAGNRLCRPPGRYRISS